MSDALAAIVAHHPDPEERAELASTIRHELARRTRRASAALDHEHTCPRCARSLPHEAFPRSAGRRCDRDSVCRACRAVAARRRRT